jgi:hypothetical protein
MSAKFAFKQEHPFGARRRARSTARARDARDRARPRGGHARDDLSRDDDDASRARRRATRDATAREGRRRSFASRDSVARRARDGTRVADADDGSRPLRDLNARRDETRRDETTKARGRRGTDDADTRATQINARANRREFEGNTTIACR